MSPRRMFRSKVGWMSAAAVLTAAGVLAGTMLASAAGPNLPKRTPAQLLLALRNAKPPKSMTAVLTETANLGFPSLPNIAGLNNSVFSATSLISGTHTIDIWYADSQHVRIALPVSFGETDLRINGGQAWLWNSHGQTAIHYLLPTPAQRKAARAARLKMFKSIHPNAPIARCIASLRPATTRSRAANRKVLKCLRANMVHPRTALPNSVRASWIPAREMTPQGAVDQLLAKVGKTTKVTVDGTTQVAGRSAYQLVIAPRTGQSLIDRIVIAVDGQTSLPLQLQVFARGVANPAFQFGFTSLNFAKPAASNFTFTPPAGAHVKTERLPAFGPGIGLPGIFGPPRMVGPARSFASPARSFSGPPPVFISRPVGWRTGKHLDFRRSWGLGRCCGPGGGDGTDFVVGGLAWDGGGKSGGDDDPAELDEHVLEGRLGLFAVPRLVITPGVDVGRVVPGPGVPQHDQGMDKQRERDGPLDRDPAAITCLTGAQDVARVGERLLD